MARKTGSHSGITGPRIREAAQTLIARHGYAAVSMRQIAAEVGVQVGTLYLYTRDKQTLLFELMDAHMAQLLAAWEAEPKGNDPASRLQAFVQFHIGYHLDRPEAVFIAYMELRNLTPENFAKIEAQRRRYEAELEAILADGLKAEVFRAPDIRVTTMAIIAMLTGVNTWYREGGRLTRQRVQRRYLRLVQRMLAPKGA